MKKTIIVTGAGRGIGRAISIELCKSGYRVVGTARSLDELKETQSLCGDSFEFKKLDVTREEEMRRFLRAEANNHLWGLVTAAGIYGPIGPFAENDFQLWKESIEINLIGSVLACQEFSKILIGEKRPGRIFMLSGGGATQPLPNFTSYCASKAAVVRFAETLALELKEHGITVNSCAPGAVNTKLTEELIAAGPEKAGREMYDKALQQKKSGGADPIKAGELCVSLMKEESSTITGKLISAVWDPWQKFDSAKEALTKSDIYTLRRIVPEDRPKAGVEFK